MWAPTLSEMGRGGRAGLGSMRAGSRQGARGSLKLGRDPREVSTRRANIGAPWPRSRLLPPGRAPWPWFQTPPRIAETGAAVAAVSANGGFLGCYGLLGQCWQHVLAARRYRQNWATCGCSMAACVLAVCACFRSGRPRGSGQLGAVRRSPAPAAPLPAPAPWSL